MRLFFYVIADVSFFLGVRLQRAVVEGESSENVRGVFGKPQGSVLGSLLILLYISDLPMIAEITLVGYADDST